ncbi:MAG TPA: MFS transporter [Pyrinomonadaceae bacterium]|jgi:DHA1 family tetracycline resistance protein-like MFS transporter
MKRSPMLVIFMTVFIDLVGFGIVIPVLPFYLESERFRATPVALGLLFASYSVMQLIFTPVLGRLSDRHGRRPVLLLSIIGTGIGFLIMGAATTLWMLFVGRVLDGITGGNISTAQAYVADITTPENRAKGMGMFGAAFGLGFIFGPALGGLLTHWGMNAPFYFAAALAFSNATLLYFVLPETVTPDHPARAFAARGWTNIRRQLTHRRLVLVLLIYFLFVVSFSIMTTTFALYTKYRYGYDQTHNGYLFTYIGIISAVIQGLLIGRLVKRLGEMTLVVAGALVLTSSLILLPFIGPANGGLITLLILLAAFSVGNSFATPSLTSLASRSVGAGEQGGVMGVTQSAASLARVIGPLIGGFLIYSATPPEYVSDRSLFLTFGAAAIIMFVALLMALYFARTQSAFR